MISRPPRGRWLARVWLGALLVTVGCNSGGGSTAPAEDTAACPNPQRGKRYAVCGHLSTVPLAPAARTGRTLQGSVDSMTPAATGGHQVSGGTFHVGN